MVTWNFLKSKHQLQVGFSAQLQNLRQIWVQPEDVSIKCLEISKGQLISEWNFGEFKSSKKWTFFLRDFCPSLIGQKSFKIKVCFLGDLKTPKFPFEINWPSGHFFIFCFNVSRIKQLSSVLGSFVRSNYLEILWL